MNKNTDITVSQKECLMLLLNGPMRLDQLLSKISSQTTESSFIKDLKELKKNGYLVKKLQKDTYEISPEGRALVAGDKKE